MPFARRAPGGCIEIAAISRVVHGPLCASQDNRALLGRASEPADGASPFLTTPRGPRLCVAAALFGRRLGMAVAPVRPPPTRGTYDAFLDELMPPSFLVDEHGELVHTFGGAARFLKLRDGRQGLDSRR